MDRVLLVPENEDDHDILHVITESFQDTLCDYRYPENIAQNLTKYRTDPEYATLEENASATTRIFQDLKSCVEDISSVETQLMRVHAMAIIQKTNDLEKELRLRRLQFWQKLPAQAAQTYNLIQNSDLCPHLVQQYLDFTYNRTLHTCTYHSTEDVSVSNAPKRPAKRCQNSQPIPSKRTLFTIHPAEIIFKNYELHQVYKQKVKLRNISHFPQSFRYSQFSNECPFQLSLLSESSKVAPGMYAEFLVTFSPKIYKNYSELLRFKTTDNFLELRVSNTRDSPRLLCHIFDPLLPTNTIKKPQPGGAFFSEKRCDALNFTIDCGTCLLGDYRIAAVAMKNEGQKGRFFVTTENEWAFGQLDNPDAKLQQELALDCFSVFPMYFEIDTEEVGMFFVLCLPNAEGVFTEKIVIISDNNSHQEVEILGDCITFSYNMMKVNMYLHQDTFSYVHRLATITLSPNQSALFIFCLINDSAVSFKYYWAIKTDVEDYQNKKRMPPDWLQINCNTKFLPSHSVTDVTVNLTVKTEDEGCYYCYISLYLENVPVLSIPDSKRYLFVHHNQSNELYDKPKYNSNKFADVHISELELFCVVKKAEQKTVPEKKIESHGNELIRRPPSNVRASVSILNFGILPKGVEISESFNVENLTNSKLSFKLLEIRYENEQTVSTGFKSNLNLTRGTLKKKGDQCTITYTVHAEESVRWVSVLAIFTSAYCPCAPWTLESVILIAYQVAEVKISIHYNDLPVLSPNGFVYVSVPTSHTILVQNAGIVTGCFYFLKPVGEEAHKLYLKFTPPLGVVPPGATVKVTVELMVLEDGIFDDIYVPCFVGDLEHLVSLRILCTVGSINIQFHLPDRVGDCHHITWPPRKELAAYVEECNTEEFAEERNLQLASDASCAGLIAENSVAQTYPTTHFGPIKTKKAEKFTFFIENLTPVRGNFSVEAANYGTDVECLRHILVKAKRKTAEDYWEKACMEGHGIVIEAESRQGSIMPNGEVEVILYIYANTWGKYLEEIIVEVDDLTPFCFNFIVDVVGLPIDLPFARNTILEYPTIRFENICATGESYRSFTVVNVSAVPLKMSWSTPKGQNVVKLRPNEFILEKEATETVTVTINLSEFMISDKKTSLKYLLTGLFTLSEDNRFKENYFLRSTGAALTPAKVMVLVTLQVPTLELDICSEDSTIDLFVNDILFNLVKDPEIYFVLRNSNSSPALLTIDIEKPFHIIEAKIASSKILNFQQLLLEQKENLQITLKCHFSHAELLDFAKFLYEHHETSEDNEFISTITRNLNIEQGICRQAIPFLVRLHYPHIKVKPTFVKFGHCLLFHTRKTYLTIYNLIGSPVKFEIYKTSKYDDFEVYPSCGEIQKNTGVNQRFFEICLYFTPRHSKLYIENLRIMTNIPCYFIDVPLTGHGTNNEKFSVT